MFGRKTTVGRAISTGFLVLLGLSGMRIASAQWFDSIARLPGLAAGVAYEAPAAISLDPTNLVIAFREEETGRILTASSPDSGQSWSSLRAVLEKGPVDGGDVGLRLLQLGSGRLILSIRASTSTNAVLVSDDQAANWSNGVSRKADGVERFGVVGGDLWHVYADHATGDLRYETSPDGQNWSEDRLLVDNQSPATTRLTPVDIAPLKNGENVFLIEQIILEPCCGRTLILYRSSDPEEWIGPEEVYANRDSVDFTASQVVTTGGSVFVLGSATGLVDEQTGLEDERDIFYLSASSEATGWSGLQRFTRYPGDDFDPAGTAIGSTLTVFFASDRFSTAGIPQIWYGRPGGTPDDNPPPAILHSGAVDAPSWSKPGVEVAVSFAAADAESVVSAEVVVERDSSIETHPLYDDGEHGDGEAGDGIWGGTIGPFDFGPDVAYFPRAFDQSGQAGEGTRQRLEILPVHDVGRVQLALSFGAAFGDFFVPQNPPADAGQWPGSQGQNYIAGGGLWVGTSIDSVARVMHSYYDVSSQEGDWRPIQGLFPEDGANVSDQDLAVTYSDSAAPHPIGLEVRQSSRQWAEEGRDNFIIFEYEITNTGSESRDQIFATFWLDPDLVLENNAFAYDDLVGWDAQRDMVYAFDSGIACNDPVLNPENVLCPPGYLGLVLLRHPIDGHKGHRPHTTWVWNPGSDPSRTISDTDEMFMDLMTKGHHPSQFDSTSQNPDDYRFLETAVPFSLEPNETASLAFGIVIGANLEGLQQEADAMLDVFAGTPLQAEDRQDDLPKEASITTSYPNPFSSQTTIQFEVETAGPVTVSLYDLLGSRVAVLVDNDLGPGNHRVKWNATGLPSGVYFYRVESGPTMQSGRLVKVR